LSWSHSTRRRTLITADSLRSLMRLEFAGDYFFLPASWQFRLKADPQLVVWFKFQCAAETAGFKADSIPPTEISSYRNDFCHRTKVDLFGGFGFCWKLRSAQRNDQNLFSLISERP
jgi:hypothetical protein